MNVHRESISRLLIGLVISLGLILSGCSSDDEDSNNEPPDSEDTVESPDGETAETTETEEPKRTGLEFLKDFQMTGLSGDVDVNFDENGVLHIDCQTDQDCYQTQGYFHAYFRFFQMDLIRRQTTGRLAGVIGSTGLDSDKSFRHIMTTRDGEPLEDVYYEQLDSETKNILKAYAEGVNSWLDDVRAGENGASLTNEYDFPLVNNSNLPEWKPQDSIALYLQLSDRLSNESSIEALRGRAFSQLDENVAADLFTPRTAIDSNIMDVAANETQSLIDKRDKPLGTEAAARLKERFEGKGDLFESAQARLDSMHSIVFGPETPADGSNNWVIGSDKSNSGNALLANDPHLGLSNPAIWYYVEMDSKQGDGDLHAAGASVPAVPGVVVGHNENLAWGVTTARMDLTDLYVETLNEEGDAVMFNGQEVPIETKEFTFEVYNGESVTETFEYVPHHGPIISKDVENQRAVSLRWSLHQPGDDIGFLYDLMESSNVDEAMSAVEKVGAINQSFVFIDTDDNIGWYPHSEVPSRPWASSETPNWLPVPGDGSAEWDGYLSNDQLPKLKNPAGGYIATANNDFDGSFADGDPTNESHPVWQASAAYGARHARISNEIEKTDEHTLETINELQADTKMLHAEQIVPEVISVADNNSGELSDRAGNVLTALKDWDYTCPTGLNGDNPTDSAKANGDVAAESIGCSAFHVMVVQLTDAVFQDELAELDDSIHWARLQVPLRDIFVEHERLNKGTSYFDEVSTNDTEETKATVVAEALDKTAAKLETLFESDTPDDWRWGRIHTVSLESLFASAGVTKFNHGPFASDGGVFTVDVAEPVGSDEDYSHSAGPSLRLAVEATESGMQGTFQLPGGQDHHRESKWYASLLDEWLADDPSDLLFEDAEVEDNAEKSLVIEPK